MTGPAGLKAISSLQNSAIRAIAIVSIVVVFSATRNSELLIKTCAYFRAAFSDMPLRLDGR